MRTLEILLAVLAVIDFIGAILAGLLGQKTASLIMVGLLPLLWIVWITREVTLLRKKIGILANRLAARQDILRDTYQQIMVPRRLLEDPLWISSVKKNQQKIDSDFLNWEKCTLMLWVLVPKKGNTLRDETNDRYLIGHQTDHKKKFNQFALLRSCGGQWEVRFSNDKAETDMISIDDGLNPGWHHFLLAWDRVKPNLVFLIDGSAGGSNRSKSHLPCWPERVNDVVTIGAWATASETSYCETSLFGLWILNNCLEPTDPIVKSHLDLIKRITQENPFGNK